MVSSRGGPSAFVVAVLSLTLTACGSGSGSAPTPTFVLSSLDATGLAGHAGDAPPGFDVTRSVRLAAGPVLQAVATKEGLLLRTAAAVEYLALPALTVGWSVPVAATGVTDLGYDPPSDTVVLMEGSPSLSRGPGWMEWTVRRFDTTLGTPTGPTSRLVEQRVQDDGGTHVATLRSVEAGLATLSLQDTSASGTTRYAALAVDLDSGEPQWHQDGRLLGTADGAALLAASDPSRHGRLVARDLGTGKVLWTALPGAGSVVLAGSDASSITVLAATASGARAYVLDVRDGVVRRQAVLPGSASACLRTGATAVCSEPGSGSFLLDLGTTRVTWTLPGVRVVAVVDRTGYGVDPTGRGVVVDLTGGRVVGRTPFVVTTANGYGAAALVGGAFSFVPARY